ncbi:MAG: DMT family transporter, partial [Gammaproteobacteria bacterium]|nr:DMT family transporter [Gammaproteobacteria bacterium]
TLPGPRFGGGGGPGAVGDDHAAHRSADDVAAGGTPGGKAQPPSGHGGDGFRLIPPEYPFTPHAVPAPGQPLYGGRRHRPPGRHLPQPFRHHDPQHRGRGRLANPVLPLAGHIPDHLRLPGFPVPRQHRLLAALVLSVGSIFYIMALLNTTVANVVFIIGASPLLAALAGWLFLRERVTRASLASMFAAILGIGLMFADGLVSGGMLGNVFALCLAIMYVFYLLILRGNRHVDMMPATCLSGLFTAMIVLAFVVDFAVSRHDLVIILALGSVQFGFGFMCLTWSTRYIPAAEVALFSLSEAVLNPIWVWLGVGETPSLYTLAGSAVVLAAVMTYSIMAIRRERAIRAGASASGHS